MSDRIPPPTPETRIRSWGHVYRIEFRWGFTDQLWVCDLCGDRVSPSGVATPCPVGQQ